MAVLQSGKLFNSKPLQPLIESLYSGSDYYLLSADFQSYLQAHHSVEQAFKDKRLWAKRSILCTAGMGKFSSDRTIQEYARDIWNISPIPCPDNAI